MKKNILQRNVGKVQLAIVGACALVGSEVASRATGDAATDLVTAGGVLLAAAIAVGVIALTWKVGARFISKFVK